MKCGSTKTVIPQYFGMTCLLRVIRFAVESGTCISHSFVGTRSIPSNQSMKPTAIEPNVADPINSIPDHSHAYGTRKSFPVYGSFTMDPGAKPVTLSTDLKTLTMTERLAGQSRPKSILVFNRE